MQLPGTPSLVLLLYLFVFLPYLAFRSARVLRALRLAAPAGELPGREMFWVQTTVSLVVLFVLAWMVGRSFDYDPFALRHGLGLRDYALAAGAFLLFFAFRLVVRAARTEEERRRQILYALAPRNGREWAWSIVAILVAAVAEETAYRGVAMNILWYSTGNPWLSAALCAVAFALAHWMQGWKSGLVIFLMALAFHALCAATGTLVLAMVIHALYDLVAAVLIAREAEELRAVPVPS